MAYTDLTTMRNDFLVKTQGKLLAKDFNIATENDLIIAGAMVRAFDSVNNFDPVSLTALSFISNVGDLDVFLADISNRDSFEKILANSQAMAAVAASSTAMTAVAASSTAMTALLANSTAWSTVVASSTAMTAVAASSTAMTAVAASSTAMTAIWGSNTASDVVLASTTARLAVYNSDVALAALQANPTQVQRQINGGIAGVTVVAGSTTAASFTYASNGTKVILLRMWITGGNEDPSLNFARGYTGATNSTTAGIIVPLTGENLGKTTVAFGHTTTYANSGTYPSVNNDNANIVCAANGLARHTWSIVGSTTQNVLYILV